jgi:hypothetical protein
MVGCQGGNAGGNKEVHGNGQVAHCFLDWECGGGFGRVMGAVSRQAQAPGCSRQAAYEQAEKVAEAVRGAAGGGACPVPLAANGEPATPTNTSA